MPAPTWDEDTKVQTRMATPKAPILMIVDTFDMRRGHQDPKATTSARVVTFGSPIPVTVNVSDTVRHSPPLAKSCGCFAKACKRLASANDFQREFCGAFGEKQGDRRKELPSFLDPGVIVAYLHRQETQGWGALVSS